MLPRWGGAARSPIVNRRPSFQPYVETLEDRITQSVTAVDDSFSIVHDHALLVALNDEAAGDNFAMAGVRQVLADVNSFLNVDVAIIATQYTILVAWYPANSDAAALDLMWIALDSGIATLNGV